jgi:hypothetical protein
MIHDQSTNSNTKAGKLLGRKLRTLATEATILRLATSPKFSRIRCARLGEEVSGALVRRLLSGEQRETVRSWLAGQGITAPKSSFHRFAKAVAELFEETVCAVAGHALERRTDDE